MKFPSRWQRRIMLGQGRPRGRQRAVKHREDGYRFDSGLELVRYRELKLMRDAGRIRQLEVHPRFELLCPYEDSQKKKWPAIHMTLDFQYREVESGKVVLEDVKGTKTYRTKKLGVLKQRKLVHRDYPLRLALLVRNCLNPWMEFREIVR